MTCKIERAISSKHLLYVEHLAAVFSNQLGFISTSGLRDHVAAGNIIIGRQNDQFAGYFLAAPALASLPAIRPIFQAAVQMDAQRRHFGLKLLEAVARQARHDGMKMLQCWCRRDLESNEFWSAAGFTAIGARFRNTARNEPSILWRRPLVRVETANLFTLPPPRRHNGAATANSTATITMPTAAPVPLHSRALQNGDFLHLLDASRVSTGRRLCHHGRR